MAKTIKEMAQNAYLMGFYSNLHDWKEGYEIGANAVLEVIEDSLAEFSNTEDYSILQRKIKELKGEWL